MKTTSYCLTQMADALDISKSGFHAHRRKAERPRAKQDKQLGDAIEPIFVVSRRTYGSPRIMQALRKSGWRCGKNRIARLMRSRGLRARQKRRFRPKTTQSDHQLPVAPNWLAKIPEPDRPGQVWLGDITYIQTEEGWLYLSAILDHCSRRCVGWHADQSLESLLVTTAWEKACRNQPLQPGLLHHSDRGIQYASSAFQNLLHSCGATASMSRKANPYDNVGFLRFCGQGLSEIERESSNAIHRSNFRRRYDREFK